MSDVGKETLEGLTQFTKDLEAGDLSRYRITRLIVCPDCYGDVPQGWCLRCNGRRKIEFVVQEPSDA